MRVEDSYALVEGPHLEENAVEKAILEEFTRDESLVDVYPYSLEADQCFEDVKDLGYLAPVNCAFLSVAFRQYYPEDLSDDIAAPELLIWSFAEQAVVVLEDLADELFSSVILEDVL